MGRNHIRATRHGLKNLKGNLSEVLRIMWLANLHDQRIEHRTWQAIRLDMTGRKDVEVSREAANRFMTFLSHTPRLGDLLRRLHDLRVLEKWSSDSIMLDVCYNSTNITSTRVDEHSLRTVERATEFLRDEQTLGEVSRGISRRSIFHLALLCHDMGKGYTEDHSEVGYRLAGETARRLRLDEQDTDTLRFLVRKHLIMSHLAFRRDTSDESLILQFASEVGSVERLQMLFVLTCADFAAVGPGVLNSWKVQVLTSLYFRTLKHLGEGLEVRGGPFDQSEAAGAACSRA